MDRRARAEEAESIEEEEEVLTVEMMAMIGWKMTWSGQIKAWAEEEEPWVVTSPTHPSSVSPQLGQIGWLEVFFCNPSRPEKKSLPIEDPP